MKKYIYKCDSCGHTWTGLNPEKCPRCGAEDFHIHSEVKSKTGLIILISLMVIMLSGGAVYYFLQGEKVIQYVVSYDFSQDSVIKVMTEPKINNFDDFDFMFKNLTTNKEVKRIDNILYPCENGEIIFSFKNDNELIKIIEEQGIGFYSLKDGKFHPESGCGELPPELNPTLKYNASTCKYTLSVTDENGKKVKGGLEMSWNSDSKWQRKSFVKKFDEVGQIRYVLVRLKNNPDSQKKVSYERIAKCQPVEKKFAKSINEVQRIFNSFKNDVENSSKANKFMTVGGNQANVQVSFNGDQYDIQDFALNMMDMEESGFENPKALSVIDVKYTTAGGASEAGSQITKIIVK